MNERPYSLFRKVDNLVVTSGALGLTPDQYGESLVEGGVLVQLSAALHNAEKILIEAGLTRDNVFKTTLFLTSLDELSLCNKLWLEFFNDPRPARTTIAVLELPRKALVEVELWANAVGH